MDEWTTAARLDRSSDAWPNASSDDLLLQSVDTAV